MESEGNGGEGAKCRNVNNEWVCEEKKMAKKKERKWESACEGRA